MTINLLDPDRLFPADPMQRDIARSLYQGIKGLPIVSPHGHTDPAWFAENNYFTDATSLLLEPDQIMGHTPMCRFGKGEELDGATLLLTSSAGSFFSLKKSFSTAATLP